VETPPSLAFRIGDADPGHVAAITIFANVSLPASRKERSSTTAPCALRALLNVSQLQVACTGTMSTTLPLFWHLSSASRKERLDASVKLVSALEHFQAQFVPREPSSEAVSDEDEEQGAGAKRDGLDALNAQDVSYSIRRLVRGLASPRESSRLGFAVALTEVCFKRTYITALKRQFIVLCISFFLESRR
jgi:hypothetical protein